MFGNELIAPYPSSLKITGGCLRRQEGAMLRHPASDRRRPLIFFEEWRQLHSGWSHPSGLVLIDVGVSLSSRIPPCVPTDKCFPVCCSVEFSSFRLPRHTSLTYTTRLLVSFFARCLFFFNLSLVSIATQRSYIPIFDITNRFIIINLKTSYLCVYTLMRNWIDCIGFYMITI